MERRRFSFPICRPLFAAAENDDAEEMEDTSCDADPDSPIDAAAVPPSPPPPPPDAGCVEDEEDDAPLATLVRLPDGGEEDEPRPAGLVR